jgi:hypothetical protein
MLLPLLALISVVTNSVSFTAAATGIKKGTPVEFMFALSASDHDYESMFLIEDSAADLKDAFKKAGIPSGGAIDAAKGRLHAFGPYLGLKPSLGEFIARNPDNVDFPEIIYCGGLTDAQGKPVCQNQSPNSIFSFYSCAQSPILFDGQFNQGDVYGRFLAKDTLKKGEKYVFTFSWDGKSLIKELTVEFAAADPLAGLQKIKSAAETGPVSVEASFSPQMSFGDAVKIANALSVIDSQKVKINGCRPGNLFYRAFLPLEAWRDRSERLQQPLELYLSSDGNHKLLAVDEDWNVAGDNPKLTERRLEFGKVASYPKTDTCFIYLTDSNVKLGAVFDAMKNLGGDIRNWYIYVGK